jgi:hypothetical protein
MASNNQSVANDLITVMLDIARTAGSLPAKFVESRVIETQQEKSPEDSHEVEERFDGCE